MTAVDLLEPPAEPREPAANAAARLRRTVGGSARRAWSGLPGLAWRVAVCPATWLCLAAAIFYSSLAVDRIDQHMAGSYDFGIIFQVIHGWAFHFYPSEPLAAPQTTTEFGDHFAPMLMLLAPLLWIKDSPSVIAIAQAFVICAAGAPVYFAVRRLHGPAVGTLACVFFLTCIEVQNAIGFDIHENMFEPLLIGLAIERALANKWTAASVFIGLTLFCYEDMGAVVFLFGLWAARHRKWRHAAVLCVIGPAMMFLFTAVIVPDVGHDLAFWQGRHFDYQQSLHASTMVQALEHSLEHPRHFLHLIVDNHTKTMTWLMLLAPLGFVCLASPITYLGSTEILLLMVSDNDTHWSTNYHFYLQVAPILIIGAADGLRRIALLARLLWRRLELRRRLAGGRELPAELGWLRSRRTWQAAVALLAVVAIHASLAMESTPDRAIFTAGWAYLHGDLTRPAELNAQINRVAGDLPSNQNVYVTNDLGTEVVARDTDVPAPQYAQYVLFDVGSSWTPAGFEQTLQQQGFHVIDHDGPVFLMER